MVASKVQSLFLCATHLIRHTIIKVEKMLRQTMLNGFSNKLRKYNVAEVKSVRKMKGVYTCVQ